MAVQRMHRHFKCWGAVKHTMIASAKMSLTACTCQQPCDVLSLACKLKDRHACQICARTVAFIQLLHWHMLLVQSPHHTSSCQLCPQAQSFELQALQALADTAMNLPLAISALLFLAAGQFAVSLRTELNCDGAQAHGC